MLRAHCKMSDFFRTQNISPLHTHSFNKPSGEVICIHCKQTALDRVECPTGRHEIALRNLSPEGNETLPLEKAVEDTFDNLIAQFHVADEERSLLGLQKSMLYRPEDMLAKESEGYKAALLCDPIYSQLIASIYGIEVDTVLKDMEEAEHKVIKEVNKQKAAFRAANPGVDAREVLNRGRELEENAFRSGTSRFTRLVSEDLLDIVLDGSVSADSPVFRKFIAEVERVVILRIYRIPDYSAYLTQMVGRVSVADLTKLYEAFCLRQFMAPRVARPNDALFIVPVDSYFSVAAFANFFRWETISELTATDIHRRQVFFGRIQEYQRLIDGAYRDYRSHLMHFIRTKCLRRGAAESFIDRLQCETQYMTKVLRNVTQPHNHTLDAELRGVILKYIYKRPFTGPSGFRKVLHGGGEHMVYDFLELYTRFQVSDRIQAIVYKQGSDIRIKKASPTVNIAELLESGQRDYTLICLAGTTWKHAGERSGPAHALFDHFSMSCTVTGTASEVRELVTFLSSNDGINLVNGELISYKGVMEVVTKAKLIKPLLQELFMMAPISRYFYPRTARIAAGNYVFLYTPEGLQVPSDVTDYVSFVIADEGERTAVASAWSLTFEGTTHRQVLPFLSMTIAFLQMLENAIYDERFVEYAKWSREYVEFARRKATDSSISKKEVYLMLLRETGLTPEQAAVYGDRSRPFPVRIKEGNKDKWKMFFASVYAGVNPILTPRDHPHYIIGADNPDEFIEIRRRYEETYGNIDVDDDTNEFRFGNFVIGISYHNYTFFAYPENGALYPMEKLAARTASDAGGEPVRGAKHISREKETELAFNTHQSSRRNHQAIPRIREVIGRFTDEVADHVTYLRPQGESQSFAEYIAQRYQNPNVLRALLCQHLWDHTDDEIRETLKTMNLFLHQDLIQHLHQALIFCFEPTKEGYVYQMPRHSHWYAIGDWKRAMFLFKGSKGNYITAIFGKEGVRSTNVTTRMREFIVSRTTGIHRDVIYPPLDSKQLQDLTDLGKPNPQLELVGQLFNAEGKSIGIRVQSTKEDKESGVRNVMDLRFTTQAAIMCGFEYSSFMKRFAHVSNVRTNVTEKFGKFRDDDRFTLVPAPTQTVRYPISRIYQRSRDWKQRNYIFARMLITHWLLIRETVARRTRTPESSEWNGWETENLELIDNGQSITVHDYVTAMIVAHDSGRRVVQEEGTKDPITSVVVPEFHNDFISFGAYLTRVYPSVFYNNAFHVPEVEVQQVRDYMERELDIIQTNPPEFAQYFMAMRMEMNLIDTQSLPSGAVELVGSQQVNDNMMTTLTKGLRLNATYFTRITYFNSAMDPLSVIKLSDKSEGATVEKSELFMIEVRGRLHFLRLTRGGHFSVACHICHMWKTRREILGFEETTERDTKARIYVVDGDEIVERHDNDKLGIEATGQNYSILMYTRVVAASSRKQEPRQVFAAMLPLQ